MAPVKRKATGPSPAEKRQKVKEAQQIASSLSLVKSALKNKEYELPNLPTESRDLLLAVAEHAFKGEAEERHQYQRMNVQAIGEYIAAVREKLNAAVDEKKMFIDQAKVLEEELEAGLEAAKQALQAKKEEIKEREVVKKQETTALEEAVTAVEKAKLHEKDLAKQKTKLLKEHTEANAVYTECFLALKENPNAEKKAQKAHLKRISQQLSAMNAGDSMIKGVPAALVKALEERGEFDQMTINAVDQLFQKARENREASCAAQEAEVQAGADATEAAKNHQEEATLKLTDSTAALQTAENEKEQCEENLKKQNAELKEHGKKAKAAIGQLKTCEQKASEYDATEEAFGFLKDFAAMKPEECGAAGAKGREEVVPTAAEHHMGEAENAPAMVM